MKSFLKPIRKHHLVLLLILFATFLFRFPSLFEPFWYGDEGIFAAVASNLNQGGVLYETAWDNKPPMIYLTYQAIFKFFDVSMFWLRLLTVGVVLSTAAVIYEIAREVLGIKRALVAAFVFGFLSSLRLIEGNLALTEIFMILPISLAMFIAIKRRFDFISLVVAGFLLAIASLYKQVGVLEAAALGIFLLFYSKKIGEFLRRVLILTFGFVIPYGFFGLYFASKGLLGEYIFAAYTYYRLYLGESPRYAIFINLLKFLPIFAVIGYGFYKKYKGRDVDIPHLLLLWTAFSFLGSFFSGRTYGHYLVQAVPSVSLLLSSISIKPKLEKVQIVFAIFFFIPLFFLTKLLFTDFLSAGPINQISYWGNFMAYVTNRKGLDEYNNYFDRNVNSIMAFSDFFRTRQQNKEVLGAYIWGDYPWLYAISDLRNPSRYVTSFHVFGVPNGKSEVEGALINKLPDFVIKSPGNIGYFVELEKILARYYTMVAKIENSEVFERKIY